MKESGILELKNTKTKIKNATDHVHRRSDIDKGINWEVCRRKYSHRDMERLKAEIHKRTSETKAPCIYNRSVKRRERQCGEEIPEETVVNIREIINLARQIPRNTHKLNAENH